MKKAVYFFCTDYERDEVAPRVLDYIKENYDLKSADYKFADRDVYEYTDDIGSLFSFVETDKVLSYDYDLYIPLLNKYFGDYDVAGVVNWHGGKNAPDKILTVHSTGDVVGKVFAPSNPIYLRNLMLAIEENRLKEGLDDFTTMTEATHWTGTIQGQDINLIDKYQVPIFDIEIGSTLESWKNPVAVSILANSLFRVFDNEKYPSLNDIKVLLCTGGMHFEDSFSKVILNTEKPISIGHVLSAQWMVQGEYDKDENYQYLKKCVDSISMKVDGIVFHDNIKSAYKNQVKKLGEELGVPVFKYKKLKNPKDLPL